MVNSNTLRPKKVPSGLPRLPISLCLVSFYSSGRGRQTCLSVKGRCILAVGLAATLLPLLETPFTRQAMDSSHVCFFVPARDDELPNLAQPFLRVSTRSLVPSAKIERDCAPIHAQPSIQELGVLLMETFYCQITPRALRKNSKRRSLSNRNTRWQVCVDRLPHLEVRAPRNYYLAAKVCLEWEDGISDRGSFDAAEAQNYFYQAVLKRLESVI